MSLSTFNNLRDNTTVDLFVLKTFADDIRHVMEFYLGKKKKRKTLCGKRENVGYQDFSHIVFNKQQSTGLYGQG